MARHPHFTLLGTRLKRACVQEYAHHVSVYHVPMPLNGTNGAGKNRPGKNGRGEIETREKVGRNCPREIIAAFQSSIARTSEMGQLRETFCSTCHIVFE